MLSEYSRNWQAISERIVDNDTCWTEIEVRGGVQLSVTIVYYGDLINITIITIRNRNVGPAHWLGIRTAIRQRRSICIQYRRKEERMIHIRSILAENKLCIPNVNNFAFSHLKGTISIMWCTDTAEWVSFIWMSIQISIANDESCRQKRNIWSAIP